MPTAPPIWLRCSYCTYRCITCLALHRHTLLLHEAEAPSRPQPPPPDYGHPGEIANDLADLERT